MALKDILVHMDGTPRCAARLEAAVNLAKKHGARLTGLHVLTHAPYAPHDPLTGNSTETARSIFLAGTAAAGIETDWRMVDWGVVGTTIGEVIIRHAYYADLVVIGQAGSDRAGRAAGDGIAERVILGSGRPVMTIPYAGSFGNIGERIMVAWKAGRESTRAINDALPLLRAAREVTLATVAEPGDDAADTAGICDHLKRHGVPVRPEKKPAGALPTADALLNQVSELGIDLLVTGAFGYTAKGAPSLGSVARQLLKSMTVPLLMSH
jgi:nucleotide-binding universal stress UspA family protein